MTGANENGWQGDPQIAAWAAAQGYGDQPYPFDRDGAAQFSTAFADSRCGHYLVECTNHEVLVGTAADVAMRLPSLIKRHLDGEIFWFKPLDAPESERRVVLDELVQDAQAHGLVVRLREDTGTTPLDAVVTASEQTAWRREPAGINEADNVPLVDLDAGHLETHRDDFDRLMQHPRHREIIAALGHYVDACIPYARRTEATFWTVSCFPSSHSTRIFCVSMANVETFYLAVDPGSSEIRAVMFVDHRELPTGKLQRIRLFNKGIRLTDGGHQAGGSFEQRVYLGDIAKLSDALESEHIRRGAAIHNLKLMRKRQSAYKSSHSRQLAEAALDSVRGA